VLVSIYQDALTLLKVSVQSFSILLDDPSFSVVTEQRRTALTTRPISFHTKMAYDRLAKMLYNPEQWSLSLIKNEMDNLSSATKKEIFEVDHIPLLFYALQRGNAKVLTLMLKSGADPSKSWDIKIAEHTTVSKDPLTFAIAHLNYKPWEDCIELVKILLAYGADPNAISAELLRYEAISTKDILNLQSSYPSYLLKHLRSRLNAVLKYFILKAQRASELSQREIALVKKHSLEEMRRADYLEIGQEYAARKIHDAFMTRIFEDPEEAGPLVFAFTGMCVSLEICVSYSDDTSTGPSGHGKTNFAKAMGRFANCEVLTLDTSHYTEKFSLLGGTHGYKDAEAGSPLNNHLAKYSGKLSVVLLDEFDKTEQEIRECFLTMWDGGEQENLILT
jgi:hypothetical protein